MKYQEKLCSANFPNTHCIKCNLSQHNQGILHMWFTCTFVIFIHYIILRYNIRYIFYIFSLYVMWKSNAVSRGNWRYISSTVLYNYIIGWPIHKKHTRTHLSLYTIRPIPRPFDLPLHRWLIMRQTKINHRIYTSRRLVIAGHHLKTLKDR